MSTISFAGYHSSSGEGKSRAEYFMTRSSFRECECDTTEENGNGTSRRGGVVRSCSVGYLDLVEGGGSSNNRLVLVRQQNRPARLTHCGKSRSLDSSDMTKSIANTGRINPPNNPSSSPASPALSKKKRNLSSSPIR
jgi:hypothetical protein